MINVEIDHSQDVLRTWFFFLTRKQAVANVIDLAIQRETTKNPLARVYFVQDGESGPIKIGTSTNIKNRMYQLRANAKNDLVLLALIGGGRWVESLLHTLFSHIRIRGEWFHPAPELLEYIEKEAYGAVKDFTWIDGLKIVHDSEDNEFIICGRSP